MGANNFHLGTLFMVKKLLIQEPQDDRTDRNFWKRPRKRNKDNDFKIASWNIQTLYAAGHQKQLVDELKRYRCNIAAIQETRWTGQDTRKFKDYTIYVSGGTKHEFGTAFFVMGEMQQRVIDWKPRNDRICVLRIKGRFFNYSIINIHCPTNDKSADDKERFYDLVAETYDDCPQHDVKIIIGDMNAKIGKEEIYRPVIGRHSLHNTTNDNGMRLIEFAASKCLVICSTHFKHKDIHKHTWKHPNGTTFNQIDHMLVNSRHFSDVMNVRSYRGANSNSDHFMIMATIRARLSNVQKQRYQKTPRYDVAKLKDNNIADRYANGIATELNNQNAAPDIPINDIWNRCKRAIKIAADEVIGTTAPSRRNHWFDQDCENATQMKNAARQRMLAVNSRQNRETYKALRRQEKKIHRQKKKNLEESGNAEIETFYKNRDVRSLYRKVNEFRKGFMPRTDSCRDRDGNLITEQRTVISRWREHFDELLNGTSANAIEQSELEFAENRTEVATPELSEVVDAIRALKTNKAAGRDALPSELLREGGLMLATELHTIILAVWNTEQLPDEWLEGVILPIHKKGDKLDCSTYRGISLLNTAYKVLSLILFRRLQPFAEEFIGNYQAGFRPGLSTTDQIFTVRQILQKCKEFNITTHHLFVDFKAAYDTVNRQELWNIMYEFNFPSKLIRLLKATLNGVQCYVRVAGNLSTPFESVNGLRQGDALSCILFNVALEGVIRRAGIQTGGTIFNRSIQIIGYADDIDIVGRNHKAIEEVLCNFDREAKRIGLQINEAKTKYMIAGSTSNTNIGNMVKFKIDIPRNGSYNFEQVHEFVYLGSLVSADNDMTRDIKRRIVAANRCFYSLYKQLRSNKISTSTKCTLYKTLLRPVVMYGHESWNILANDERLLAVFERKVLRTIFGPKFEPDYNQWRRLMNHELYEKFKDTSIERAIKISRLKWAGHVARMDDNSPAKMVFLRDPEGRRTRGGQRSRWRAQVERDLTRIGKNPNNWVTDAADREGWDAILEEAKTNRRL